MLSREWAGRGWGVGAAGQGAAGTRGPGRHHETCEETCLNVRALTGEGGAPGQAKGRVEAGPGEARGRQGLPPPPGRSWGDPPPRVWFQWRFPGRESMRASPGPSQLHPEALPEMPKDLAPKLWTLGADAGPGAAGCTQGWPLGCFMSIGEFNVVGAAKNLTVNLPAGEELTPVTQGALWAELCPPQIPMWKP